MIGQEMGACWWGLELNSDFANNIRYIASISFTPNLNTYPMKIHFSFHSHPVPIARSNPLYSELESEGFYYPIPKTETRPQNSEIKETQSPNTDRSESSRSKKSNVPGRIKEITSLNRANVSEVKSYNYLLTIRNQTQLQSIRKKLELYPERYQDPNYLAQSALMILSPGWSSADRYSCCSIRSKVNPSGQCRLHRFCPYCSYLFGRTAQLKFVPSFNSGKWFFMTGSFTGYVGMKSTNDAYDWLKYWDAYKSGLDQLITDKTIRGYYLVEELAVTQLMNPTVLPHIHAIIDADDVTETMQEELSQGVLTSLTDQSAKVLEPSIEVVSVDSKRSLMDRLKYMFKPVNFVKAYEADWYNYCNTDRKLAWKLNNNTTDVILGYSISSRDRPKMRAKGTLHSRCNAYIGKKRSELNRYKPELAAIRNAANEAYIESPEIDYDMNCEFN